MVAIKDQRVKKWLMDFKKKVKAKYAPERMILFGSRARGDNLQESDVDVIIVSKRFQNVPWPRRIGEVAQLWDGLVTLEPLCYTPEEFQQKSKEICIVQYAVNEGVDL